MSDPDRPARAARSRLRELLERPDARRPVSRAVASLLAVCVVSIGAIGALVVWHLVRRGRLIRERLGPPRDVRLPETDRDRARDPDRPDASEGPYPK